MDDVARIARSLSRDLKQDLLSFPYFRWPWAINNLIHMGLLNYGRRYWLFGQKELTLSRKGVAVRAHLQQENPNAHQ